MYLNRVTLIGFLGQDARSTATQEGREVARLSLATTRRYQQDSEWKEKTQWHDCVAYGKAAAYAAKLGKGDHVLVEGELTYREYNRTVETESGPIRVIWPVTEVIVQSISRLDRTRKQMGTNRRSAPKGGGPGSNPCLSFRASDTIWTRLR